MSNPLEPLSGVSRRYQPYENKREPRNQNKPDFHSNRAQYFHVNDPSRCGEVLLYTQKSIASECLVNHILSTAPSIRQPCLCVPRRHYLLVLRNGFKMRTGRYHNSMARRSRTLLSRPEMRSNGSTSTWQTFLARIKCII